jgi:hypothetical protein
MKELLRCAINRTKNAGIHLQRKLSTAAATPWMATARSPAQALELDPAAPPPTPKHDLFLQDPIQGHIIFELAECLRFLTNHVEVADRSVVATCL